MMKTYLEHASFMVKSEGGVIYRAYALETYSGCNYITLQLINDKDEEDGDSVNCYILNESITEALEANGYTIIKK